MTRPGAGAGVGAAPAPSSAAGLTAAEVAERLGANGLRVRVDDRGESIGRKIRDAELAKVPYMLVVGDREAEAGAAALRRHREGDLGTAALDDIAERLASEVASGYTPRH